VGEVLRIVDGELEQLGSHGITDRELAVAKSNLRAEMLLSGEDSAARMSRIGASMLLHGEVQSVDHVLARIEAVERDEVLARAQEVLVAPRSLSAVGPFDADTFDDHLVAVAGH
jgi:predicted Zn-dependent peptidase